MPNANACGDKGTKLNQVMAWCKHVNTKPLTGDCTILINNSVNMYGNISARKFA